MKLILGALAGIAVLGGCGGAGGQGLAPTAQAIASSTQTVSRQALPFGKNKLCRGTNLLQDGDFETPVVPVGGYQVFPVGSNAGPWTVIGPPSDSVVLLSNTASQSGYTFNAQAGVQSMDLTVLPNGPAGLQQTVNLDTDHKYTLCFWVGNINDPNTVYGVKSKDTVMVNGSPIYTAVNSLGTPGSGVVVWKQFLVTFTVPVAGATTISFNNADPKKDNYNGLDSVLLLF